MQVLTRITFHPISYSIKPAYCCFYLIFVCSCGPTIEGKYLEMLPVKHYYIVWWFSTRAALQILAAILKGLVIVQI